MTFGDKRDGREAFDRIVFDILEQARVQDDRIGGEKKCRAIRGRPRNARSADVATRTDAVLDDDGLIEFLTERIDDRPCRRIRTRTRREGHDDRDELALLLLGQCAVRGQEATGKSQS